MSSQVLVPPPAPSKVQKGRTARIRNALIPALIVLAVLVAVWDLLVRTGAGGEFGIPAPVDVAKGVVNLAGEEYFYEALRATTVEALYGFALGASVGLVLGVLIGSFEIVRRTLNPFVVLFQNMPKPALAPMFVVWFGYGMNSKVATAATIAFFPVLINTIVGFDSVADDMRLLMRSYGTTRWQSVRKFIMPDSLPAVFAGLKTAASLSLVGAIVAEFIGSLEGLGTLVQSFNFALQLDLAFAVLVYLSLLGFALYAAVELVERKFVFWKGKSN
jgi:NitT/TauT family transport system permease protein